MISGPVAGKPAEATELREIPAPAEPRLAYPEPHLSNAQGLALIRGKTFFAANQLGDIMPAGAPHVGFFRDDTRYLSRLELIINGHMPVVLSSTTEEGAYENRIELTVKGSLQAEGLDLPVNTVYVRREQVLEHEVLYDVIQLENYHRERAKLKIEIACDADFMDIFQVRGIVRGKSGQYYAPLCFRSQIVFPYKGLDGFVRNTTLSFEPAPSLLAGRSAHWDIELEPHSKAKIMTTITPRCEKAPLFQGEARPGAIPAQMKNYDLREPLRELHHDYEKWEEECTRFRSNNPFFNTLLETGIQDFYALQMPDSGNRAIIAGVPWFAALFGRDSLIASFQTLILNPALARGTLRVLASRQGNAERPDRDEDPGKILHEMRSGEMTATGEVAFGMNYGSVDATPLFIILMGEYFRWTGDEELLRELKSALLLAVNWLIEYGDPDHDGLIEYCRKTSKGLLNQGWKDSGDANMHADGSIAQAPIALIEVQGYAAEAFSSASGLLRVLGLESESENLLQRAAKLRHDLDRAFWMQDKRYYAMALDRDKRPLRVVASNPGHLLFSNAIPQERASDVVDGLMGTGLFSGWGIRTLSREEATFNPMSYHRGSVWPHDNSLAAYGMAFHGFQEESSRLFSALFAAAAYFRDYRLPELFCGIQRRYRDEPVQYPVSCSPQAWASGSAFLILTGLLGLRPDAANGEIKIVNPMLPEFLDRLELRDLRVGKSRISLEFLRQGDRTFCNVIGRQRTDLAISIVHK